MTQILVRMHRPFLFDVIGGQRVQYDGVPPPNAAPYGLVVRLADTSEIFTLAILGNVAGVGTPVPDLETDLAATKAGDVMSSTMPGARIFKMSSAEIDALLEQAQDVESGRPSYDGVFCGPLTMKRLADAIKTQGPQDHPAPAP